MATAEKRIGELEEKSVIGRKMLIAWKPNQTWGMHVFQNVRLRKENAGLCVSVYVSVCVCVCVCWGWHR